VDHITVLAWGRVVPRGAFQSAVQLFPVGYKCEQTISGTSLFKGAVNQPIICEIEEADNSPQFRITLKSSGDTFLAPNEAAVWRKVSILTLTLTLTLTLIICTEQYNPSNIDTDWTPSFFSLHVELLLEGLDGALDCDEYKFHAERGYGSSYVTEVPLPLLMHCNDLL
jgi:hypothetical protein